MQHYFAAFCPEHDGRFSVLFPDLPDVMTSGNDIDDAMTMARNVLRIRLEHIIREENLFLFRPRLRKRGRKLWSFTKNCPDCR